jgi:hypothetical protein
VAAASALMECVRHDAGPAAFSNTLFARLLTALVLSPVAQPEVGPAGGRPAMLGSTAPGRRAVCVCVWGGGSAAHARVCWCDGPERRVPCGAEC